MRFSRLLSGVLLVALLSVGQPNASAQRVSVSIDDLVAKVQIQKSSISPDGKHVAYLTAQGLPQENLYEVVVNLIPTTGHASPAVLARYRLTPVQAMEADSGGVKSTAGQVVWSPDGGRLVYTIHSGSHMEVHLRVLKDGSDTILLSGAALIELGKPGEVLEFTTTNGAAKELSNGPPDESLVIKDGYHFFGALSNPKPKGKAVVQHWIYNWGASSAVMSKEDSPTYLNMPSESSIWPIKFNAADTFRYTSDEVLSPDRKAAVMVESAQEPAPNNHLTKQILLKWGGAKHRKVRVLVPAVHPRVLEIAILGWSADSKQVYYLAIGPRGSTVNTVDTEGHISNVLIDESALGVFPGSVDVSRDMKTAVFVRSTNLMPAELVAVDLKTGKLTPLSRPNAAFDMRITPLVRFISIETDPDAFGRLYLPSDYRSGTRYPLVITQYYSHPGFEASVGDEVPVQALVEHGIAVFAMHSSGYNMQSTSGNLQPLINRLAKPLVGMDWVIRRLAADGVVDPERVGLTGLSYGSEIAMYAYWKSHAFRALSAAGGSVSSLGELQRGPVGIRGSELQGFPPPEDSRWNEIAAGLNARSDLPPLLLQTPDGEEFWNVENWTELRVAGAEVEWYEYPNEGHVKRGPANKWWVYQRNLDWFRFWLQGYEDPDNAKADQYRRWEKLCDMQVEQNPDRPAFCVRSKASPGPN